VGRRRRRASGFLQERQASGELLFGHLAASETLLQDIDRGIDLGMKICGSMPRTTPGSRTRVVFVQVARSSTVVLDEREDKEHDGPPKDDK
jgi:hypothetical protein